MKIPSIKPNKIKENTVLQSENTLDNKSFKIPKLEERKFKLPKISLKSRKSKVVLAILIIFIFFLVVPVINFAVKANRLKNQGMVLVASAQSQNLDQVKSEITNTRNKLADTRHAFKFISWTKYTPFVGGYFRDLEYGMSGGDYLLQAGDITIVTLEPYADVFGIGAGESTDEQTAKDRFDVIARSLPEIEPKIGEISKLVNLANEEISKIEAERYPEEIRDVEVRENIKRGQRLLADAAVFTQNSAPILKLAPDMLGMNDERIYFVLFQNDKELRPTGGFMTAYSIMKVRDATFEPVISTDIYDLDTRYKPQIQAPEPIVDYIKGPYIISQNLRLRDMNWSPDFEESMDLFTKEAADLGLDEVDGIIAVDTQVVVDLLDVIGEIGVPGFGNFSTEIIEECNCPQVIYELESFADVEGPIVWDPNTGEIVYRPPNSDNRKEIIGPLMNSIMANTLGQPKEKFPELAEVGFNSILEKHVMFYMMDDTEQSVMREFGAAGTIEQETEGDYLHINNANLGGRKSNLYVTYDAQQVIEIADDGTIEKTLTLTYKNPEEHDGWLNSVLPNWVRIYVPKGSELVDSMGLEDMPEPYEEFGKSVFAGFFSLRPLGVSKVTLTYKLPFKANEEYIMFIQKQPGTSSVLHSIELDGNLEEVVVDRDTMLHYSL